MSTASSTSHFLTQYPKNFEEECFYVSHKGMKHVMKNYDPNDNLKNIQWTVDYNIELPIRLKKYSENPYPPQTLIEAFEETVINNA